MPLVMWTPASITLLTELILVCVVLAFMVAGRLRIGPRAASPQRPGPAPTDPWVREAGLFTLMLSFFGAYVLLSFLHVAAHPAARAYVDPLVSISSSLALACFVLATYRFPIVLRPLPGERHAVLLALGLFVGSEIWYAIYRYRELAVGHIEFRPAAMDFSFLAAILWSAVPLVRQIRQLRLAGLPVGAARTVLAAALLPLALILLTLARSYALAGAAANEIALTLSSLLLLATFGLIFFNFLPGVATFSGKIVAITLVTMMTILSTMAWLVSPVYVDAYRGDGLAVDNRAFFFTPLPGGSYRATESGISFDDTLGTRIDPFAGPIALPFGFPFYGHVYRDAFVREDGMVGFAEMPLWRDVSHRFGGAPAIYPLAVDLAGPGEAIPKDSGVFVDARPDRVRITWYLLPEARRRDALYSFRATLYPNGQIELAYLDLPADTRPDLYESNATAWFAGITPGYLAGGVAMVRLGDDLPYTGEPMQGLVQDFRLGFVDYLDRIYRPIAWYVLAVSGFVVLVFPAFFRVNLARPLDRLLLGVQQFRKDGFVEDLPIAQPDEIGYLTSSFNEMARSQHAMMSDLEARVERRTAEASALAARNARLEERSRISGDLHDSVSQTLFSATLLADALPEVWRRSPEAAERHLDEVVKLNRSALSEMRALLTEFRPAAILDAAMGDLLAGLVADLGRRTGIDAKLEVESDGRLPEEVHLQFYRILQECLNNVAKHAAARTLRVYFDSTGHRAILTVEDDGGGFDMGALRPGAMGLAIMRERAARAGASLEISSEPGRGTRSTLIWTEHDGDA